MLHRMQTIWANEGIDIGDVMRKLESERDVIALQLQRTGGRYGPVSGFIIPTLRAIGLYGERTAGHFKEMWTATQGGVGWKRETRNSMS